MSIFTNTYTCGNCGKTHAEWPALTFDAPLYYSLLSAAEQQQMAELNSDFCVIHYPNRTDHFIRCTLTQKVIDHCEDLDYGIWVSLSKKSFQDYADHYGDQHPVTSYFGWLSNDLPEYTFQQSIPTNVNTRADNQRPEIIPHQGCDHPFVHDYYNGITKAEAEHRIQAMMNNAS
jgi:hypothetical protein